VRAPFIGRDHELRELQKFMARLGESPALAALLVGEPGIGKSRLLSEAAATIALPDRLTLTGYETQRDVPFAATAAMLQPLSARSDTGSQLSQLLLTGTIEDRGLETVRLFEATHQAVRDIGPTLMLVDDLQWLDRQSGALLHYLVQAAGVSGSPLVALIASRPAEQTETFADSLAHLLGDDRFLRIDLAPLAMTEGVSLVHALQPELDQDRAEEFWRLAHGSPFWLELLSRGGDRDVSVVISRRLRMLGVDAESLLAVLGVAGHPLTADELAAILGWPPDRVEVALAGLRRQGLVSTSGAAIDIVHDLLRDALVQTIPDRMRRQLHSQLVVWLESRGDDLVVLKGVLDHRVEAGMDVTTVAVRLASSPQRRLLGVDGLRQLVGIADTIGWTGVDAFKLQESVASLADDLGELRIALDRWSQIASLSPEPQGRARAQIAACRTAFRMQATSEAHALLRQCRADHAGDLYAIELDALESRILAWLDHDVERAARLAERGLANARIRVQGSNGQPTGQLASVYLAALEAASDLAQMTDDTERMLELAAETARAGGETTETALVAMLRMAIALRLSGSPAEGEAKARAVWDIARRQVRPHIVLESGIILAICLLAQGKLAETHTVIAECGTLASRIPRQLLRGGYSGRQVEVLRERLRVIEGPWAPAIAALEEQRSLFDDPHFRLAVSIFIFWWLGRIGGPSLGRRAVTHVAAARQDVEAAHCPRCRQEFLLAAAETLGRVGELDSADAALREWEGMRLPENPGRALFVLHDQALVAMGRMDHAKACTQLEELIARLEARAQWVEALVARLDFAAALAGAGDNRRAADTYRQAGQMADRMGAGTLAQLADQGLRTLGVRTWRRSGQAGDSPTAGLTKREQQITAMLVRGASNAEIASALFLSRKTVERHVSNVLARIGARNRTELVAMLGQPHN
jgi:DNA-binding CsgD family transcriptional regulator